MTEWWLNETLQLQSFVHEEIGAGTWEREIGLVPITTRPGERLATLDISKPGHPRFIWVQPFTEESSGGKFGTTQTIEADSSTRASSVEADAAGTRTSSAGADAASPNVPAESHGNDGVDIAPVTPPAEGC